ncbi:MAG: ferredoxin [Thermoanaerobaculia bacterium]
MTTPATPAAPATTDELRRFHFGDPAVRLAPLAGMLPVSLAPYRGKPVRNGWPLLVDLTAAGESWLRPLAFAEGAQWTEGTFASAAGATLVEFGRRAPLALMALAARRRLKVAREAFAGEVHELAATAEALLAADRARRPEGAAERARGELMGGLGTRFVDPAELAHVVGRRRAGTPFPEARRQRLEAARDRLKSFETAAEPLWIVAHGESVTDLGAPARIAGDARDLCAMAAAAFDDATREAVELARAVRVVRLEAAEAYVPERHSAWLERLDWRALAREELLLVPPVLVLFPGNEPFVSALASLSGLLLSGRPVQIVVLSGDAPQQDPLSYRLEPAYLGVAHREVFVQQGSLAYPLPLAAGFDRALAGRRAGLHVIDAPDAREASDTAGGELDAWLVALARVAGRAAPLFRFDPEAGSSWARRLHFDENPEPSADWPRDPLLISGGFDAAADATAAPSAAAFTFADTALLDPAWRSHFALAESAPGAAAASGEFLPLADWLQLDADEAVRHLPFVWGVDAEGGQHRLVVSRALAIATRDRLAYWRMLEELAGVRNEHVEAAVVRARDEAEARRARQREELEQRHASELAQERSGADQRAVDQLVSILFELGPNLAPAEEARPRSASAVPAAALPAAPAGSPQGAAAAGPAVPAAPAAVAPVAALAASAAEEAWIDTVLCTSCDECIRKSPGIFAYNADKQAFIKNPRGGTYRELVVAAEACTAKIIHPGTPWNSAEPDIESLRERARAFA